MTCADCNSFQEGPVCKDCGKTLYVDEVSENIDPEALERVRVRRSTPFLSLTLDVDLPEILETERSLKRPPDEEE